MALPAVSSPYKGITTVCKNLKTAQFHCYRLYGHTDVGQSAPGQQKHYYNLLDHEQAAEGELPYVDNENRTRKPLCILYGSLKKREEFVPPDPIAPQPGYIQRLKSRSRNPHVEFSERYEFDRSTIPAEMENELTYRIQEFDEVAGLGQTQVDGFTVHFVFNPVLYNEAGAIKTIQGLYGVTKTWKMADDPYFNRETCQHAKRVLRDRAVWNAQFITAVPHNHIDAWFEIEHGLFWTIDNVNVWDFRENFERTVRAMELRRRKREAARAG